MLKYPESTPCPVLAGSTPFVSSAFHQCESTEEIDFTTEIQAALRQAAPRRRKSVRPQAQAGGSNVRSVGIGRDAGAITAQTADHCDQVNSQPAFRHSQAADLRLLPARRRASLILPKRAEDIASHTNLPPNLADSQGKGTIHMHKKPRRRTIYVPSDDTTIFTIHPGIQSDTRALSDYSFNVMGPSEPAKLEIQPPGKSLRQMNRKPLAAAPKRAPLQPTLKPLQETEDQSDIPGAGPGKENLPPSTGPTSDINIRKAIKTGARRVSIFGTVPECDTKATDDLFSLDRVSALEPSRMRNGLRRMSTASGLKHVAYSSGNPVTRKPPRESMMNRRNTLYYGSTWKKADETSNVQPTVKLPSKLIAPVVNNESVISKERYSILAEDIDRPEMFEDAWLVDQESAIQQLVNGLFDAAHAETPGQCYSYSEHRRSILQLYQGPECLLLYKRLQASLLFGALSPPEGSIAASSRLKTDIGLRQRFVFLWTGTYSHRVLRAAAEVVVGRQISTYSPTSNPSQQTTYTRKDRKKDIVAFITSCLLCNEDAGETEQATPTFCWRRTVLRSLMLVFLLDKASKAKLAVGNLFRASSKFKASRSVLTELTALLLPFIGDVCRPLSHLDYHVHYTQFPLSEYDYKISNLATDLRDGIRLSRLVENLLYPPQSLSRLNENVTVAMPTGEVLTSNIDEGQSWVLSQHLKYPCTGRAQKIYNVQITLSALRGIHGVGQIAEHLSAEDIVDGHREKTVTLLWSLVGKWGLDTLVDFDALSKEIRRLRKFDNATSDVDEDDEQHLHGLERHTCLLRTWARTIACRHGLRVLNLTTSFADGRVFGKIVDEYRPYLPQDQSSQCANITEKQGQLDARLRDIGCSASFASIFEHNEKGRVFDRDFTIAALAFLCSRLLRASERGRAAGSIQRAFRKARARQMIRQRCILLKIAHDCKAVLDTRNRVMGAARVLQGAWREYLRRRKDNDTISRRRLERRMKADRDKGRFSVEEDSVDIWLS
ncbi:hypothetical protein N7G274_000356 [Stereocaulon virgatum]|uniref:Calponin-homology (CH) domain-containing protein n=1 Tax=Stereocaulon virgatum TaxID=373712 RepID=A0ABR4ASD5_9LECA